MLGLVSAVALGLGAGASVYGAILAAVIGGVAFALASPHAGGARAGRPRPWLARSVRRFIPISLPLSRALPLPFRGGDEPAQR